MRGIDQFRDRLLSGTTDPLQSKSIQMSPAQNSSVARRRTSKKQGSLKDRANSDVSLASFVETRPPIKQEYRDITLKEMMSYYTPKYMAVIGFLASVAAAFQLPLFGYILSQYVFVLALPIETADQRAEFEHRRDIWTWAFVGLVFGIGLSSFLQKLCFGLGGDNLTFKLRVKLFEALLRKDIGWYDNKDRAPGILTNIISDDVSQVNGLTTEAIGVIAEAGLGLVISCAICFVFSVELAFIVTLISPFMVLGGLGMAKLQFN